MKGLGPIANLLIAVLIVSMIAMGLSSFYVNLAQTYNLNTTYYEGDTVKELQSFKQIEEITSKTQDFKNKTESITQHIPGTEVINILTGAFGAVSLAFNSVFIFQNMIGDAVAIIGVPAWAGTAILGIVIIIIVFTILSAGLKWRV